MGHDEDQRTGQQDRRYAVCIVDDHEIVRDGIRWLPACTDDLRVVAEAGDVDDGLQVAGPILPSAIRRIGAGGSVVDGHVGDTIEVSARPAPGARDLVADLTGQERRILELSAAGATNHEIADALFLAEKTVRNYVSNLLAKLGVRNRTQAATMLVGLEGRRAA